MFCVPSTIKDSWGSMEERVALASLNNHFDLYPSPFVSYHIVRTIQSMEELQRQLLKEKLSVKFYQDSERTALQSVQNLNDEIKALRQDLVAKENLQKQMHHDLGIAAANIVNLEQQNRIFAAELAIRAAELSESKSSFEATEKSLKSDVEKATKEKKMAESQCLLLRSQVEVLSGVLAGNIKPEAAALPSKLTEQFDAAVWKQKFEAADATVKSLQKEVSHLQQFWKEERMESQRANILLICYQKMVEHLTLSTATTSLRATKEEQERLASIQEAVAKLNTSQISEILKDNQKLKKEVERFQSELASASQVAADLRNEVSQFKKERTELRTEVEQARNVLKEERTSQIVKQHCDRRSMLEQGSTASILMTFFSSPSRCPHCKGGLSDTLGLDLLAEACGCSNVGDLVNLMVVTVAERISAIYQETLVDHVAAVTPPTTLTMASQLAGPVPSGLMFFPPEHFAKFIQLTDFISEAQAYSLAVQYLTSAPRLVCCQENIEMVLDSVRFLWLGVALIEHELRRIETEMYHITAKAGKIGGYDGAREVALALLTPRNLIARLTQSLRVKSTVFQVQASSTPEVISGLFLNDPNHPVVQELQRVRHSYVFLPRALREQLVASAPAEATKLLDIPTLIQVQPMCV